MRWFSRNKAIYICISKSMFLSSMHDITRNQLSWPFYYKKCEAMQLFPSYLKNEGTALEMQMSMTVHNDYIS